MNVEKNAKNLSDENAFESLEIDTLFYEFEPKYHFVQGDNFAEAINQFATANKIDLIIIIPKKHGLFESVFHKSRTKELAFHSSTSLMVVHA